VQNKRRQQTIDNEFVVVDQLILLLCIFFLYLGNSLMTNLTGAFNYLSGEVGLSADGEIVSISSPWAQTYINTDINTRTAAAGGVDDEDNNNSLDVSEVVDLTYSDNDDAMIPSTTSTSSTPTVAAAAVTAASAATAAAAAASAPTKKNAFTKPSTSAAAANVAPAIRFDARSPSRVQAAPTTASATVPVPRTGSGSSAAQTGKLHIL
jgi:hypothetical protein